MCRVCCGHSRAATTTDVYMQEIPEGVEGNGRFDQPGTGGESARKKGAKKRARKNLLPICTKCYQTKNSVGGKLLILWWTWSGSNRRPLPCHGSALPSCATGPLWEKRGIELLQFSPTFPGESNSSRDNGRLNKGHIGASWPLFETCLPFLRGWCDRLADVHARRGTINNQRPRTAGRVCIGYRSVNNILAQVRQTSQNIDADLGKMRIEKWKADSGIKRDVQGQRGVGSCRNLQSALPEMITQLSNAPEDIAASFNLYRNLDALYDVFGQVVEAAGAFGSKDEYQEPEQRHEFCAERPARVGQRSQLQNLAAAKEGELARLRNQIRALQAATRQAPPEDHRR